MTRGRTLFLLSLTLVSLAGSPGEPGMAETRRRAVAIILDTSGSMRQSDQPRYTVQISQIVSDLLADRDELTVIGMPTMEFRCSAGPSSRLAMRLDPGSRKSFKSHLDSGLAYDTGTHFAAPIHTAAQALARHPDRQRMLLIVADSGGLGGCEGPLTRELQKLHGEGALIAAVNLGSTAGAFDRNPAFDFTTAALDAHALVEAVGLIYQRFLGAKTVQTGRVAGAIEVDIAPHVREAFLVVAADGPMGVLRSDPGNPGAERMDLDHRGGGTTRGLDSRTRGYRIARLVRPTAGRWTFRAPDLTAGAGWLLIQDLSSLGLRLVSPGRVARGVETRLVAELYDLETGAAIRDLASFPGLTATLTLDGRPVRLSDDGNGALAASATFETAGARTLPCHLESDWVEQDCPPLAVEVLAAAWNLRLETPPQAVAGSPLELAVVLEPQGDPSALTPPQRIEAVTDTGVVPLLDDGGEADRKADDGIYTGVWTPQRPQTVEITYRPVGTDLASEVSAPLEVLGYLALGETPPISLGPVRSESVTEGRLDLSGAEVRGSFEVAVSSDFESARAVVEVDPGDGWVALGVTPVSFPLTEGGPRIWPLRLRVGSCPAACSPDMPFHLRLQTAGPGGVPSIQEIPLTIGVIPDPWLTCWWPVLATAAGLLLLAFVLWGFISPSRFPPRLGVQLSPEEDLAEGFFHPIRAQRGTGSGFYRDARAFVRSDYRLSGKPAGAVACLRAHGKRVLLNPVAGASLLRRTADDSWEPLPAEEASARFGQTYRNESGTLFFEIRNG